MKKKSMRFRRTISALLALTMMVSVPLTAFATSDPSTDGGTTSTVSTTVPPAPYPPIPLLL